jgi:hypothetical protein
MLRFQGNTDKIDHNNTFSGTRPRALASFDLHYLYKPNVNLHYSSLILQLMITRAATSRYCERCPYEFDGRSWLGYDGFR